MTHDFNKPPHVQDAVETNQKKRIPVLLLIIVGIFLASLIFYMVADRNPQPGEIPVDRSIPAVQDNNASNSTATATEATTTEAAADTSTASDR